MRLRETKRPRQQRTQRCLHTGHGCLRGTASKQETEDAFRKVAQKKFPEGRAESAGQSLHCFRKTGCRLPHVLPLSRQATKGQGLRNIFRQEKEIVQEEDIGCLRGAHMGRQAHPPSMGVLDRTESFPTCSIPGGRQTPPMGTFRLMDKTLHSLSAFGNEPSPFAGF